jgi:hypothetical protein
MNNQVDNLYCIRFERKSNNDAIKHNALCTGKNICRKAVVLVSVPAGHRVFQISQSVPDYIEGKTKAEQDKKSGIDKQIQAPTTPVDLVSDNQNSNPAFTDEVASFLSAIKSNTELNH